MNNFLIQCLDAKKQPIGEQNISMSYDEQDKHKILFADKEGNPLISLDMNGELVIDNTSGRFDAISTDKPMIKVNVSGIKMDYEENLTFSLDGSKTTYKISGNSILSKNGSTFEPLVQLENPLDIVLPSTIFEDIESNKLVVNGFPFQMFNAFSEEDTEKLGVTTFESKNQLLHLVKYNNQLYVGRGHKLIPVDIQNQNLYKMGDNSVLGFTVGKLNGISGKQSSGIAFSMSEEELEQVAKFINGDKPVSFKTEEDFKTNDIDYVKVNRQSDLSKFATLSDEKHNNDDSNIGVAVPPKDTNSPNSGESPTSDDKPKEEKPKDGKPSDEKPKDGKPSDEKPKDEKPKDDKKQENVKEASLDIAKVSTVLAAIMGILLISGVFVSILAFTIFAVLAVTAISSTSVYNFKYRQFDKVKRSKSEKLRHKLAKKEYALDRLNKKEHALFGDRKKERLNKSIESLKNKIKTREEKETNKQVQSQETNQYNTILEEQKSQDILSEEQKSEEATTIDAHDNKSENVLDSEIVTTADEKPKTTVAVTSVNMLDSCKKLNDILSDKISYPPEKVEEYDAFIDDINSTVSSVCQDGVSLEDIPAEEQELYQEYINYRTSYIARQSAKESLDKAKQEGQTDLSELEKRYTDARTELNNQINTLFEVSSKYRNEKNDVSSKSNDVSQEEKQCSDDPEKIR